MANEANPQGIRVGERQELEREGTRPGPVYRPDVDILESSDAYVIYADLPGVDQRHVEVRLEKGTLTLDAQPASAPDPGWTPVHAEYRPGGYHREFRVSEDIDTEGVTATMRAGVLELRLPKSRAHRPRSIEVQPG